MARKNRDRTTGLPLPSPVVPSTSICLRIDVPNALEYRTALKGVLSELGKAWTWSQTEGEDNADAYAAAELWRERIDNAIYSLDCGDDVDCNDVADCITNSPAVKNALNNVVPAVPIDGYVYPPGVPLTPSQMTTRLNEIDVCAFDPYWSQVEQYVDYMVNLGQDVLDQIALYNTALDAGENIPMGKFLGKLKNSSSYGKVMEFLQWVVTTIKAAYEAADNTANRDAIKCAIFCQFRDDCLITIQGTLDVLNERLGGLLTPSDLNDLPSMIDAFTTAAFNPALAIDLWITFLMGSAKTAGMFGLQGIDETLQLVLAVAVNDANNDWETKCEDCDDPPPPDPACLDLTASEHGFVPQGGTTWSLGNGFGAFFYSLYNESLLRVFYEGEAFTAYIEKVVLYFSIPVTNVLLYQQGGGVSNLYTGSPVTTLEFSAETIPGWADYNPAFGLAISITTTGDVSGSQYLEQVCVYEVTA